MTTGDLQRSVETLTERAAQDIHQKRIDVIKDIYAHLYDRASTYTNLVMMAGYAGSFTLWGLTKEYLTKKEALCSAILLGISLIVFIFWEVYKMIINSKTLNNVDALINAPISEFEDRLAERIKHENNIKIGFFKIWPYALWTALVTGFCGAGTLIVSFIAHLFDGNFL